MTAYILHHLLRTVVLLAPLGAAAFVLARRLLPRADAALRLAAALTLAFGLVAAVSVGLGVFGALSFTGYAVALWLIAAAVWIAARRRDGDDAPADQAWPAMPWALLGTAVVAATILVGAFAARLAQPAVEYDALTYHLHFALQWLTAGRVFLIDTPFGDAAAAYAPSNGSLWFAFLMAAWQGPVADPFQFKLAGVDALAKVGQFPFYLMMIAALLALGRRLSDNRWTAYLPAILVSFVPWTVRQATTPAVDLMMAGLFVTALALAQHRRDDGPLAAAALSGLALGLALGVKFVALTYAPLVAAPILFGMARRRDARGATVWVGALVVSGLPWYLRNWVVAGNPLFPLDITIGNWDIWSGAYARAAMLASPFHAPSWDAALAVARQAAGWWMAAVALLGIVTGLVAAWRQPAWRAYAWIAPVGIAWHFALVPYSSQDRFLLWIVALALLPLAAWPVKRVWAVALTALAALPVVMTIFGAAPWNPAAADGLLDLVGWRVALLAAALLVGGWALSRRLGAQPWLSWARGAATALLIAGWLAGPHGGTFVRTNVAAIRELPFAGYVEVWKRRPKVVAYAGRNRPYYLAGREGLTGVRYVNPDGCANCLLHDYVARMRADGTLDRRREKDDWRGQGADEQRWLAGLQTQGVEMLMIEPLHPFDRAHLPHDADGYPLELAWAAQHPDLLTPLPGDGELRLFAVR